MMGKDDSFYVLVACAAMAITRLSDEGMESTPDELLYI